MESDQIKLQSLIDYLTSGLVLSHESTNKIKTNWATTRIVRFHLYSMQKNEPKKTNTQFPITIDAVYFTVKFKKSREVCCYGFEIWNTHHQKKIH